MATESLEPLTPVDLVSLAAERLTTTDFHMEDLHGRALVEMERYAGMLGLLDKKYIIDANVAFMIPKTFPANEKVTFSRYGHGLFFEGNFVTYSQVHIGRLIGIGAVRAICMTFDQGFIMPDMDTIPDTDLLYVPVLAVSSIQEAA